MNTLCPCCGNIVESDRIGMPLGPIQHTITEALMKTNELTHKELYNIVYANRKFAIPPTYGNIYVQIHRMKNKLARFGIKIIATTRGSKAKWRLENV